MTEKDVIKLVDEVVQAIVHRLRHIDTLDEVPGAKIGFPKYNVLWDAACLIEREFGHPLQLKKEDSEST